MSEKKIKPQDPTATPTPEAAETDDKTADRKDNYSRIGRKSGRTTNVYKVG